MTELLPNVVVETAENADSAVIWLHGLGSDGHDFEAIVPALTLDPALRIRFVFPHAPIRPVTVNGGMEMRAWYDIYEMTLERKVDKDNIDESCQQVNALIEEQIAKGIDPSRIILAGFSQGGVIAYHLALATDRTLAGVMALSTYLADPSVVPEASESANGQTPFLINHGTQDNVVALSLSQTAEMVLKDKGFQLEYKTYDMPHSVSPEQIKDISEWLNKRLSK